jgi:hypothetical protein
LLQAVVVLQGASAAVAALVEYYITLLTHYPLLLILVLLSVVVAMGARVMVPTGSLETIPHSLLYNVMVEVVVADGQANLGNLVVQVVVLMLIGAVTIVVDLLPHHQILVQPTMETVVGRKMNAQHILVQAVAVLVEMVIPKVVLAGSS